MFELLQETFTDEDGNFYPLLQFGGPRNDS